MTPSPGIEPGLHWWEANAQPLRHHPCSPIAVCGSKTSVLKLPNISIHDNVLKSSFKLTMMACLSVIDELVATGEFDKLSKHDDETEHSIELHLPYIAKVMER